MQFFWANSFKFLQHYKHPRALRTENIALQNAFQKQSDDSPRSDLDCDCVEKLLIREGNNDLNFGSPTRLVIDLFKSFDEATKALFSEFNV